MARRTSSTAVAEAPAESTAPESTEEVPTPEVETTEADAPEAEQAEDEGTESEDTSTDEGEEESGQGEASAEPAEFDLGPFEALAKEVSEAADKNTGSLAEGDLDRVLAAYKELPDTKVRNRAKKHLQEQVAAGIENLDMAKAKSYLTMHDNMKTGAAAGGTRQPADPKARWQQQLEIVTLAYGELFNQRPEGVTEEQVNEITNGVQSLSEDMTKLRDWHALEVKEGEEKPEAPKVDDRVSAAIRLARGGKVAGGSRAASTGGGSSHEGPRRNIAAHIQSAFAEVETDTFLTVAQIAAHKSEEYGDDKPSPGAISARLFPASGKCTVEGIEPGTGGEKNQRGARKVA
jgi:hypothetical protein